MKTESVLRELELEPEGGREQLAAEFSPRVVHAVKISGLAGLVEQQVLRTPNEVAVLFPGGSQNIFGADELSYSKLDEHANRLANFLRERGAGPGVLIGICAERSLEMIVAVLAVIKAGAAYVPFDPAYPEDRLRFMVEDTKAKIILTQEKWVSRISSKNLFCLDSRWSEVAGYSKTLQLSDCHPHSHDLAYVIYTSGSTGRPKGVAMRHGALLNLLNWQNENWSFPAPARTLQFASLNFDVSFQEIFSTWTTGGTLVLVDEQTRRDSAALLEFLNTHHVQRLFLPFVALKHLAEASAVRKSFPRELREVITAGEQLKITPAIREFFSALPDCTLENQYGPSETHVVTSFRLQGPPDDWPLLPSIGRAISNAEVFLLDEKLDPVHDGDVGEIFLGGECLARGYLNRPNLTLQKFVSNPFTSEVSDRLYKTGDLGKILPDGNIEFLGRIDHQVKVGGFRIEPGEIEATLHEHPEIGEAVVVTRETEAGDKKLVAFYVPQPGKNPRANELREFLRQKLPAHFIPAIFARLDSLPLNPNGKIDRRALPETVEPEEDFSERIKMPVTPLHLQLQLVFERFLRRRPIGIDSSFFELGGDSLQALGLILEIERVTKKKLPIGILYQAGTIEGLAKIIEEQPGPQKWSAMVPLQPLGSRPPLFLIHTTPGDVLGYGGLVYHLGIDQPCFGLQSLAFHQPEKAHRRIDEMAAYYIKLIRAQQPVGPYFLGGWCYGGIIAVEMAHQLLAAGEKIALLALIETPAPAPSLSDAAYYLRRIGCLLKMKPREWMIYLREKIKYYRGVQRENEMRFRRVETSEQKISAEIEELNRYLDRLEFVYQENDNALKSYRSRPYPGRVILFNAVEQDPALIRDSHYGWAGLAREIETHVIPGNHDTILMEPQVRILAEKLDAYLKGSADCPQSAADANSTCCELRTTRAPI